MFFSRIQISCAKMNFLTPVPGFRHGLSILGDLLRNLFSNFEYNLCRNPGTGISIIMGKSENRPTMESSRKKKLFEGIMGKSENRPTMESSRKKKILRRFTTKMKISNFYCWAIFRVVHDVQ